jgi:hypothetical protein
MLYKVYYANYTFAYVSSRETVSTLDTLYLVSYVLLTLFRSEIIYTGRIHTLLKPRRSG